MTQFHTIPNRRTDIGSGPTHLCRPPAPSRATRKVPIRSKGASCVTIVGGDVPHEIRCESGLEGKAAKAFLARADVFDVREQPPAVHYLDAAGQRRKHTFDFLVTLRSGEKVLVEVKPYARAERSNLLATMKLVAKHVHPGIASRILIVTDRQLGRNLMHDVDLTRYAKHCPDPDADLTMARIIETLIGSVTVGTLIEVSGLEERGFASVVRLIADGKLRNVGKPRIGLTTQVAKAMSDVVGRAA